MFLEFIGRLLAKYLNSPISNYRVPSAISIEQIRECLVPGDILLVEGNLRFSTAIKYLTQSTWSHATLYIGDTLGQNSSEGEPLCLIEADLEKGVIAIPLSNYANFHTRICRPRGLTEEDKIKVIQYAISRLGNKYDLKHIIDLLRYLLPTPPVPTLWRRRLLALGSGEPTKAICSTLIAQAFQSVRYPILPDIKKINLTKGKDTPLFEKEIYHIRHFSLFAPRDFDISPYFEIIKPTMGLGFNYKQIQWDDKSTEGVGL